MLNLYFYFGFVLRFNFVFPLTDNYIILRYKRTKVYYDID